LKEKREILAKKEEEATSKSAIQREIDNGYRKKNDIKYTGRENAS